MAPCTSPYNSDNAVIDTYECVNSVGAECFLEMYYSNGTFSILGTLRPILSKALLTETRRL